jgi:general secretion pathway protein G
MLYNKTSSQEGFTLIEIVIAIAIVGFMMAAVTVGFKGYQRWARRTSTQSSLRAIQTALNTYKLQIGTYPNSLRELMDKPSDPKIANKWQGPYLEKEPEDGWGQPLHYQLTRGGKHAFELFSDGDPDEPSKIDVWDL